MRLDRYLAECGYGTRSEVKALIKKGKVLVNNRAISDAGTKVNVDTDVVLVCGEKIEYEQFRYFMLNKPAGCVSATRDGLSSTVIDILSEENTRDLFPVGRLDKDTEGLLLITNDGQLAHRLLSPKKHVDKKYIAYVSRSLDEEKLAKFENGLDIGDEELTLPAKISAAFDEQSIDMDYDAVYEVIIREGRYHQIKRMFEVLDSEVVFLKRVSMGSLLLDPRLLPGEYKKLTLAEIEELQKQ